MTKEELLKLSSKKSSKKESKVSDNSRGSELSSKKVSNIGDLSSKKNDLKDKKKK